ncbi:branched-chain amino acid ABC transporter permease [Aquabacter spiritensis]|uniref:Amino acid/amide ABC transporter membrane protein 1 (HAAT family) n=1 Tax=Aquabacter spiritensis TaxID=933073 RepID=A0A4R3LRE4_9HYPH|nr:branched-chain amino acid ABC transporter permease [Aquabacter spiritensis]TCT02209.1 amino acid/amide ABC transporter membrane protein 1 (HAAT family) [Aquabacter spiritensis]
MLDPVLIVNAIVSGLLLGCLYAIASMGLAVSFGMLDVVNIAHPAMMVLASFVIAGLCSQSGLDPLLTALLVAPAFGFLGVGLYRVYHHFFEQSGDEAMQGLAFFFGLMILIEVSLVLIYGADQRWVETSYGGHTLSLGPVDLPLRMLLPAMMSLACIGALFVWLRRSFTGRAVAAVAQDRDALRFLAINPIRIKAVAFGISVALAAIAAGCLIVVQPVDAHSGHVFIGRILAIVILAGLGSLPGTLVAALLFGVIENLAATLWGPAWSPAVAFGLLLAVLTVRPQGIFGGAHT